MARLADFGLLSPSPVIAFAPIPPVPQHWAIAALDANSPAIKQKALSQFFTFFMICLPPAWGSFACDSGPCTLRPDEEFLLLVCRRKSLSNTLLAK